MTDDELIAAVAKRRLSANRTDSGSASLRLFAPVSPAVVAEAEKAMGLRFPPLLSRLYCEVGNGGYGPGFGMLGLPGGYHDGDTRCLPQLYLQWRSEGGSTGLLPLWDWGCGQWSCLDVRTGRQQVVTESEEGRFVTEYTMHSWMESWVAGTDLLATLFDYEEETFRVPFTDQMMTARHVVRGKGKKVRRWR